MTQQQIAAATGAAWKASHQVITASAGDSLKVLADMQGGLQGLPVSMDAMGKALPIVQQVQAVMAKLTGQNQDQIGKAMVADILQRTHGTLNDAQLIQQVTNVGNEMVGKAMGGKGGPANATKIYEDMLKQNPEMAEQALQSQWHNVQTRLGLDILPKLVPLMERFADALGSFSDWMGRNQTLVTNLALGFGALAGMLALGGVIATTSSALRGLKIVLTALSGSRGIAAADDMLPGLFGSGRLPKGNLGELSDEAIEQGIELEKTGGKFGKVGEIARKFGKKLGEMGDTLKSRLGRNLGGVFSRLGEQVKALGGRFGSFGSTLGKTVEGLGSKFGSIGKLVERFGGKLGGVGKVAASEAAAAEGAAAKTAALAEGLGVAEGGGLMASLGGAVLATGGIVLALGAFAYVAKKVADHLSEYNLTPHQEEDERIRNAIKSAKGSTWHDAISGHDYALVYKTTHGAHGAVVRTADADATIAAYRHDHAYSDQVPPVTVKTPAQQALTATGKDPVLVRVVNVADIGRGCLSFINNAGNSPYAGASTGDLAMSPLAGGV